MKKILKDKIISKIGLILIVVASVIDTAMDLNILAELGIPPKMIGWFKMAGLVCAALLAYVIPAPNISKNGWMGMFKKSKQESNENNN